MKIISFIAFFSIIITSASASDDFSFYPAPLKAPAAMFEDKDGTTKTLGHYQGKVIILNFWATWCKPCIVEMPGLNNIQKKYGNKVAVLPVIGSEDIVSKVRSFYRRYKLRDISYYKDISNFTTQSYKVTGVPVSFVFNKDGKLVAYVDGLINWETKENLKFIESLINEK